MVNVHSHYSVQCFLLWVNNKSTFRFYIIPVIHEMLSFLSQGFTAEDMFASSQSPIGQNWASAKKTIERKRLKNIARIAKAVLHKFTGESSQSCFVRPVRPVRPVCPVRPVRPVRRRLSDLIQPPTKYKYKDMEETIMFEQVNGVADCTVSSWGHTLVTPTRAAHDLVLFAMYLLLLTVFAF